ncbi:MAG: sulfite exporter TauE/SafE family protein [Gammaproteobacteria bacterium]
MPAPVDIALVAAILLVASTVHAGFGFGTALVAMPPLVMLAGLPVATPLVGLAALASVLLILARDVRRLDFRAAGRLLAGALPGIPLGVMLIRHGPADALRHVLGVLLTAYCLYSLWRPALPRLESTRLGYAFGFLSGVLGGAYNTNAPPVVLHGALAGWSPERLRATLQAYFLPSALLISASHGLSGLYTPEVLVLLAGSLPAILLGNRLGAWLAARANPARFTRALYALLAVLGVVMLL